MLSMRIGAPFASLIHPPRRDVHHAWPCLALGHLSWTVEAFYGDLFYTGLLTFCRTCRWVTSPPSHRHELLDERRRRPES
jgi:hypothetical protein